MHVSESYKESVDAKLNPSGPSLAGLVCLIVANPVAPDNKLSTSITCSFGKGHSEGLSSRGNSLSSMKHNEGSIGRTKLASAVSDSPFSSVITNRMLNNTLNDKLRQFQQYINTFWIKVKKKKKQDEQDFSISSLARQRILCSEWVSSE